MGQVERTLHGPPEPSAFTVQGRVAFRSGSADVGVPFARLADPVVRTPGDVEEPPITAHCTSAAVVLGKLASSHVVKARAYLVADGSALTIKAWQGTDQLARQEQRVRQAWRAFPEFPVPSLLYAGTVPADRRSDGGPAVHYIVEPVIEGRHPFTAAARVDAALDLLPTLARGWHAYGPVDRPVSTVFDAGLLRRLRPILSDLAVTREIQPSSLIRLYRRLWRLLRSDRLLPCVPGHGDMVSTNIIRDPGGRHVLIDWEHGRDMPIAFDVVKLLLTSGQPLKVNHRLADTLEPFGEGHGRYQWHDQLALGVCRLLTWAPDRRDRAYAAGRGRQFDTERKGQVRLLAALLHEPSANEMSEGGSG